MTLFLATVLFYMMIGGVAGFFAGLFGIGGGIILVPCFAYSLAWLYPDATHIMQVAIGTSLSTILVTGVSSLRAHAARQNIRRDILARLAPGIVLGSLGSAWIADQMDSASIKIFFACMIFVLAVLLATGLERFRSPAATTFPGAGWTTLSGGIIGFLSGLLGIGGATLSIPYMSFYRTEMRQAVGTASALGLFIAIPAVAGFILTGWSEQTGVPYTLGYIYGPGALAVVSVSFFTAIAGARTAHQFDQQKLRRIFAGLMMVVAFSMLW